MKGTKKMDKTDFEISILQLDINEPEIMKRMRAGVFTKIEAGFIICGLVNCLKDRENDWDGFVMRMERISILVDSIVGSEKQ